MNQSVRSELPGTGSLLFRMLCAGLWVFCVASPLPGGKLTTVAGVESRLASQIQRMIDAGHLAPGVCYVDQHLYGDTSRHGYQLDDYWHNPGELIYTLAISIPYLPADLKEAAKSYLKSEFERYPPHTYVHMGPEGALREIAPRPPEYAGAWAPYYSQRSRSETEAVNWGPGGVLPWKSPPFNIYACWKYAEIFPGEAPDLLRQLRTKISDIPTMDESWLLSHPHILNAYIAGFYGYLNLQTLAGETQSKDVQQWLSGALQKRRLSLEMDPAGMPGIEAGGFVWLVPELGEYLRAYSKSRIEQIVRYQEWAAPYWHIASAEESGRLDAVRQFREGYKSHINETASQFRVRAYVLGWSREQLEKYLDAPGVYRGDLTYIQNLVMTLQADGQNLEPPQNLRKIETSNP